MVLLSRPRRQIAPQGCGRLMAVVFGFLKVTQTRSFPWPSLQTQWALSPLVLMGSRECGTFLMPVARARSLATQVLVCVALFLHTIVRTQSRALTTLQHRPGICRGGVAFGLSQATKAPFIAPASLLM